MRGSFTLGRMLGIPILLHYSWLLIAALIVFSLAAHFTVSQPGWSGSTIWTAAAATTTLFFLSLVLHELAHAVVARRAGLPVHSITLFAFGGLARINRDASRPGVEFAVAAVGPLASVLIGIVCTAAAAALGGGETAPVTPAVVMLDWLGYINFVLAGFNLLPAFPLDGGRVLRAIVWRVTGSASRATRIAAATGLVVAVALIGLGLFVAFTTGSFGGLWLAILGWFLSQAAAASRVQLDIAEELRDVRVGEVMARDCTIVDPGMPLQEFVDDVLLRSGSRCFVAAREGRLAGWSPPRTCGGWIGVNGIGFG